MMRPRFHPFLRLLIFIGGSVALIFLVARVIALAMLYSSHVTPGMPPPDFSAPGVALFFTALSYPPLLLWTWFCRHVFDRRNYVSLGLGIARAGRNFAAGGALGALAMALIFCVLLLCGAAKINGVSPEAFTASAPYIAKILLLYSALYFAVGYFEETIFRGYLLQNFSALLGRGGGIVAQAALFALIHLGNPVTTSPLNKFFAMLNIALIGALLALCYRKSGSLWYPIGFHAAWNFFQGCVFSLPVSGTSSFRLLDVSLSQNTLLTGGAFGPEGGVLPVMLLLVMLWQAHQLPDHARAADELDALRRGESLHPSPISPAINAAQNDTLSLSEIAEAAPEYSPPRYQTTLGAPPRRAATIDWSDVNTRGGVASTVAFTPGSTSNVAPINAASASHLESVVATATIENASHSVAVSASASPVFMAEEAPREYSPVAFTPNIAPPRESSTAPENRDDARRDVPRDQVTSNLAASGEAPLPAGARVTASRSNFGAAARTDNDLSDARVLASESQTLGNTTPRAIEAPPRLASSAPPLPAVSPRESEVRESETAPAVRSISAPPLLPTSLPEAPPLPAREETSPTQNGTSTQSETPRLILAPPPAFPVAEETPQNAIDESAASTRAPSTFANAQDTATSSADFNAAAETENAIKSATSDESEAASTRTPSPANQEAPISATPEPAPSRTKPRW